MTINIIPRHEWNAREPRSVKHISTPTPHLFLHHTADNNHGHSGIRAIQDFHMDGRGWSDIAYSFLVDKFGNIFEGRGAGRAGAHTRGYNSTSHAICAVGNYQNDSPTQALLNSITSLVRYGHEQGWWPEGITGGHRDVGSTSCPGQYLYSHINSINRNAKSRRYSMLVYTKHGTPDGAAASFANDHIRPIPGVFTTDPNEASAARSRNETVVVVGGPAARDIPDAQIKLVGADRADTAKKVIDFASNGWKG